MNKFEPLTVKLEGVNLVEASAGTGKTYSIGLLVLRLLVEKKYKIKEILMVTFTNEAVAELASRIRSFIQQGIKVAEGDNNQEEPIVAIINKYKDNETLNLLKVALSELDEASIQTIHSFCQESLNNFALVSGQPFGLSLQPNILDDVDSFVKEYWRNNVTKIEKESFAELTGLSLKNLNAAAKEVIAGKEYAYEEESKFVTNEISKKIKDFENDFEARQETIIEKIRTADWKNIDGVGQKTLNKEADKIISFKAYWDFLVNSSITHKKIAESCLLPERNNALEINSFKENCFHSMITDCVNYVKAKLEEKLQNKHLITYDEIINRMHKTVHAKDNDAFRNTLRKKYKAIFIDEFQDTDKLQYEIYNRLFNSGNLLFYIGDPKQSIYAWRRADLYTYAKCRKEISEDKIYEMPVNFRSTSHYISAVESFYDLGKDPFHTDGTDLDIKYVKVASAAQNKMGLQRPDLKINPLQIFEGGNKNTIKVKVGKLVGELLNKEKPYKIDSSVIEPSDIAILVRTNKEGKMVKSVLAQRGIHAVTIDDTKVFEDSQEAKSIRYIMEAVLKTSEKNISKALLNDFTGFQFDEVFKLKKDEFTDLFREFREQWTRSGFYSMMRKYMDHFGVMEHLMKNASANGLRILSNLTQLLELLQEAEYKQELKPIGLYNYLGLQIAGNVQEGDEYIQRMESDEKAVKIMTIHKAKGLEYSIVIAPFLDLINHEKSYHSDIFSFRESGVDENYKFYCKPYRNTEQTSLFKKQLDQENCRLLYVTLTRAKYNCFLFKTSGDRVQASCLTQFIVKDYPFDSQKWFDHPEGALEKNVVPLPTTWGQGLELDKLDLADKHHGKLSFSALSAHSLHALPEKLDKYETAYDQFIFKDIPGGKNMGTMLHYLFENIDFTNPKGHQAEVDKLVNRYYPAKKELLRERLLEMVDHVLHSQIQFPDGISILLKDLDSADKLNEMEFDFNTSDINLEDLKGFDLGDGIDINCNMVINTKKGLLTGLIDLFFVHEGKYYILDWKSNFLGDNLEHYAKGDTMKKALNEGNYHLQYLIYSMAVKNYLEARLDNFDYDRDFGGAIYVYLRGARKGTEHGIYTNRPTLEQVEALERIFKKPVLA
ncbi:UvrD-helicase domain-containing protein [Gillisia sp. Q332]|uniref:UvrD-helicase domain-containing protein n=1 Tax=Gillisia xinjiangensis TaxID=3384765 RepID=UPI00391C50BA